MLRSVATPARAVGVHDDNAPATVLGLPFKRLLACPGRRSGPERLVCGWVARCASPALRIVGLAAYLGHDGVLDAAQVLRNVRLSRDTDEHWALALAADTNRP